MMRQRVRAKSLFGNSVGPVRRFFFAITSLPILADAAGITKVWRLANGEKSLAGPPPPSFQTASKPAAL